jgi:hypothetical protein
MIVVAHAAALEMRRIALDAKVDVIALAASDPPRRNAYNARKFGLEKDYGTVAAGKIANVLLLTENPLASVRAWNSIDKVILRGEAIEREELAASSPTAVRTGANPASLPRTDRP